ncbi:MAG: TlpA disulfide reductase family protein [Ignavibacteriaceae bacterium]
MKIFKLFFVVILFHSANFATIRNARPDSTISFITTEKHLSNGQKTGTIKENFWNVELKTIDGKILEMKSFKGKYVYLNFWGEWCPGCREEMPSIVQAYKKFKDKAEFIGLLKPHNLEKAKIFIAEQKIKFPIVLLEKQFKKKFNFDGFPLSILIFPDGKTYLRADEVNKNFFEENIK